LNAENEGLRGRGRPRDGEIDANIRDTAWALLADHGYEGLTFEALAESVGCSRATLYRRFASKDALLATILDESSRAVEPVILPEMTPREALLAHAMACRTLMSGHQGRALLKLDATLRANAELGAATERQMDQEIDYYRRELLRIDPRATRADLDFASHTLVGSIIYHAALLRRELEPERVEQLVDQAIALLEARRVSHHIGTGPAE